MRANKNHVEDEGGIADSHLTSKKNSTYFGDTSKVDETAAEGGRIVYLNDDVRNSQ